jgi:hypothetical protein
MLISASSTWMTGISLLGLGTSRPGAYMQVPARIPIIIEECLP